jgi:hypothetical protein
MPSHLLATGQSTCYDTQGLGTPCPGSGQDAESRLGAPWPSPRWLTGAEGVTDALTGLVWSADANLSEFPLTWQEALDFVAGLNQGSHLGRADWRLPNRRELRSLICHQSRLPALPPDHPFAKVFQGWYWTSTSAAINPAYAWYVHLEGGRMFYGRKEEAHLLWPVRGPGSGVLPATGQRLCFDAGGHEIPCPGSGQDGELRLGAPWPSPRLVEESSQVRDRLTGLLWWKEADLCAGPVNWREALEAVALLNRRPARGRFHWRLPNINELESLVDCSGHSPALPASHPFQAPGEAYWSSTTSFFAPDWAWALYLHKGACGVGQKKDPHFLVWPVSSGA